MRIALVLCAAVAAFAPRVAHARPNPLAGDWRGTSTCVDRAHFPSCKDEQVIYEARVSPHAPDTVVVRADKIVDGQRLFMGEYDVARQADSTWVSEVQTPRYHLRLTLALAGDRVTGTLTDLTQGRRVRDIALTRVKPARPAVRRAPRSR